MFTALGVGGGSSLLGGMAVLLVCISFLFYKYGKSIRIKSPFAPTGTKKPDKTDEAEKGEVVERHSVYSKDSESGEERRGYRESMDSNPFDYVTDDPNAGHFAGEGETTRE